MALEAGQVIVEGEPQRVLTDERVVAAYLGDDLAAVGRSGAAPDTPGSPTTDD